MQLFSATQEYFATVTEDNRLKVWDVSSGAVEHDLKERDHLSYKYTCIAWAYKSPLLKSSSKRSKAGTNGSAGLIALGTSTGVVVLWDLQKAEVVQRLVNEKEGHGAAISDVAFNTQGSLLYAHAAGDKHVLEWNVKDAVVARKLRCGDSSSNSALKLAVSPEDETLATGGTAIKTVDLSSGKKARKLIAGISSAVHALAFSPCKRYLFSSTVGGRFVNMYDLARNDMDEPVITFSMPSPAASLSVRTVSSKKKADVLLAAVSTTGALFVWRRKYKSGDKSTKPVTPDASSMLTGASGNDNGAGILLAQHRSGEEEEESSLLVVVRGSTAKPVFETVALVDEQGHARSELAFAPISEHLLLNEAASNKKKQKLAVGETTHVPALAERSGLAHAKDVVDATAFDELTKIEDVNADDELTLAERVDALRERVESDLAAELARAESSEAQASASERNERPDASSLSTLLEQALQSKDNAMLEYCLRTRDAKVIGHTIKRVASVKVLELLEILVLKFEKSPGRCARLCPWIRSILLHHTAYLMTQPDLVTSLSALYQILENRLKVHDALQRLSGRLSLVIGQIHEAQAAESEGGERAKIVYKEDDETDRAGSDEEREDAEDEEEEDEEDEGMANGDDDDDEDDAMDSDDDDDE